MRFRSRTAELPPTMNVHAPLIDVVFLLLVFFLLTLRIVPAEGRFPTHAPRVGAPPAKADPEVLPPFRVRLSAAADGSLSGIRVGATDLGNDDRAFERLQAMLVEIPAASRDDLRVTILAYPDLAYTYALRALSACSRRRDPATGRVEPLVEHVDLVRTASR